jgi:hypothetical protein
MRKTTKNEDSNVQRERAEITHFAVRIPPEIAQFLRRRYHLLSGASLALSVCLPLCFCTNSCLEFNVSDSDPTRRPS